MSISSSPPARRTRWRSSTPSAAGSTREANIYLNGDYTVRSNRYLYVSFNAAPGSCTEKFTYFKAGSTISGLPTPTREGYTFLGWYDKAVSGGTRYADGSTAPALRTLTLYAQWKEN